MTSKFFAVAALVMLTGCGQERYALAPGVDPDARWPAMMDCRQTVWAERGGPTKALLVGFGAGLGGAAGGALIGAGVATVPTPEKYSDAVDRCMLTRGYVATRPNPVDH